MAAERHAGDPNMLFALRFADGLGRVATLPSSLAEIDKRARLIERLDSPFLVGERPDEILGNLGRRIRELAELTEAEIPDVDDPLARVAIVLRLWAGCLAAAKAIALETRSGANTRALRATAFASIDELARTDRIFAAGVEAAPRFKKSRNERYSLDGVPSSSPIRRRGVS